MHPALTKYLAALKDPKIPAKGIVRMAKDAGITEADVIAARAELAAEVVATVADAVVEAAPTIAEVVAELSEQAGGPDVDADAARANLERAGAVLSGAADLVDVIASGPRLKPRKALDAILAIFGVTDSDHDGDVDALDALHALFVALAKPKPRLIIDTVDAPTREPGAAVRLLRSDTVTGPNGRPWRIKFRDIYSGAQADFLASKHPSLIEPYPPKR